MGLLYTRMKIFHFKDKLYSLPAKSELIHPPLNVRIKPTNICNHNCSYCAYRAKNLQLGQDMSLTDTIPREKMFEIVDDLIDMGVKAVTFSGGGDPFCYPYLLETAQKLTESPIKFAALTNGARLTGAVAEVFAHNATWLRVSMDGWDDNSYCQYRGCPDGEFSRIMQNMGKFKQFGGTCYLGVCLVVDDKNCRHIYQLIKMLQEIGVNSVKVSPCIVSNSGSENNLYHAPIVEIVKEQTVMAKNDLERDGFEIFDSYHTQLETFEKPYAWCPYLQISPVIGADLNVYSCHDKAYNLKQGLLGAIKDCSFKKLWNSDKSLFYRINPELVCNHHCVVDGSNRMIHEYLQADSEHLDFV